MQAQPKAALEQLEAAEKLAPQAALPKLMLATAHLSQAMSRKIPDRHLTVLTAFAYFQVPRDRCWPLAGHQVVSTCMPPAIVLSCRHARQQLKKKPHVPM